MCLKSKNKKEMSETNSVAPLFNSIANAIKMSIKSSKAGPVDRALGAAATLGLSLAILRLVGSSYGSSNRLENGEEIGPPSNGLSSSSNSTVSHFLFSYLRRFLRRMLLEEEDGKLRDDVDRNPSSFITHSGSCHCDSVAFEVVAPRCLTAREGTGKIQYRHTKVKTSNFKVFKGHECLKTYYVVSNGSYDKGAHAFCERCGVHVLYAPQKNSPNLFINVNCLAEGIRKVRVARGNDSLAESVPADGQWDDFDLLSTVSEVTRDSRWNFQFHPSDTTVSTIGDGWNWRSQDRIDENSVSRSATDYSLRKPYFALSPSLTATTESQMSSDTSLSGLNLDDRSTSASTIGSARPISLLPKPIKTEPFQSPANQFASPELRDQMKYYMKKHITPTNAKSILMTPSPRHEQQTAVAAEAQQ